MTHLRLILKGLGTLPHVGAHPGTCPVMLCCFIGALAGGYVGFGIMAAILLPLYFYGAYQRAKESEILEAFWPHKIQTRPGE